MGRPPPSAVREIIALYLNATPRTVQRDLMRAIELCTSLPTETAREQVAVYMDGLSQLRSEWSLTRHRRPVKHR